MKGKTGLEKKRQKTISKIERLHEEANNQFSGDFLEQKLDDFEDCNQSMISMDESTIDNNSEEYKKLMEEQLANLNGLINQILSRKEFIRKYYVNEETSKRK